MTKLQEIVKEQSSIIDNSGLKGKFALDTERKIQMLEMDKTYFKRNQLLY